MNGFSAKALRLTAGAMIVMSAMSCGGSKPATPKRDASAIYACEKFLRLGRDAKAGIVTNLEFRQRLQEVHEDARLSDPTVAPGVKDAAEQLLAAVTQRSPTAQASGDAATRALLAACNGPGAQRAQ